MRLSIEAFNEAYTPSQVLETYAFTPKLEKSIRCPLHPEKKPSLFVGKERVYCFVPSCQLNAKGRGESAFGLYKVLEKLNSKS